jgi:hypothetical protein
MTNVITKTMTWHVDGAHADSRSASEQQISTPRNMLQIGHSCKCGLYQVDLAFFRLALVDSCTFLPPRLVRYLWSPDQKHHGGQVDMAVARQERVVSRQAFGHNESFGENNHNPWRS